jgi:adenosylhomocysteine nucleosidase
MSAMREEIESLVMELGTADEAIHTGMRTYHWGLLWDIPVVMVYSRIGNVAAATTATHLVVQFGVDEVIFTGVAGAVDPALNIGDIVVGDKLYQHDMDARPLFLRHEIPLLDMTTMETDRVTGEWLLRPPSTFWIMI